MGKRPCHAKKNDAHLCGLLYQSTIQDRMATENARIVLAACTILPAQGLSICFDIKEGAPCV